MFPAVPQSLSIVLTLLVAAIPRAAVPPTSLPDDRRGAGEVTEAFSFRGKPATAWKVRYEFARYEGLAITGAWFRRAPGEAWIQVLGDPRLSEMFVPYDHGEPRLYDMTEHAGPVLAATRDDASPGGRILDGAVVREVRDTGVEWREGQQCHRGEALVLWLTVAAGTYEYLIQYTFHDESTVDFAVGATALNNTGQGRAS